MHPQFEYTLVTPPAATPVSLAEAKAACRVLHSDEDTYITLLIAAAVGMLDGPSGYLAQAIVAQSWTLTSGPTGISGKITLPFGPVSAVTAIKTHDGTALNTATLGDFRVLTSKFRTTIEPISGSWPTMADRDDALQITLTAGAANADAVGAHIKQAILLLVAHWFRNRETVLVGSISKEIEMGLQALLVNERRF